MNTLELRSAQEVSQMRAVATLQRLPLFQPVDVILG